MFRINNFTKFKVVLLSTFWLNDYVITTFLGEAEGGYDFTGGNSQMSICMLVSYTLLRNKFVLGTMI